MLAEGLFRKIPNSRLTLPEPMMAWVLIIVGVVLIALGTLCAMRIRSHMWGETTSLLQAFFNHSRETIGYLIHDYDQPDKPLMFLGLFGRVVGGLGVVWGMIGLIWT